MADEFKRSQPNLRKMRAFLSFVGYNDKLLIVRDKLIGAVLARWVVQHQKPTEKPVAAQRNHRVRAEAKMHRDLAPFRCSRVQEQVQQTPLPRIKLPKQQTVVLRPALCGLDRLRPHGSEHLCRSHAEVRHKAGHVCLCLLEVVVVEWSDRQRVVTMG